MRIKFDAVFLIFLIIGVNGSVDFIDCGHALETIEVKLEGCTSDPCEIHNEEEQEFQITIDSDDHFPPLTSITASAEIIQMGISWTVPISPEDVCKSWDCPLDEGLEVTFTGNITYSGIFLQRPGKLKIMAFAEEPDLDPLFCVKIDIVVVA